MKAQSPFISPREVIRRLNIHSYCGFNYISHLLPHMEFTEHIGRFFVAAYIDAYADWLKANDLKAGHKSAQAFANLRNNREFVSRLIAKIESRFSATRWLGRYELCALMGVTYPTLISWYDRGLLDRRRAPNERLNFGREWMWVYDVLSLRQSLEWRTPHTRFRPRS